MKALTADAHLVRVQLNGCPRCHRPVQLDHVGDVVGGKVIVDLAAVDLAQRLHFSTCAG